MSVRLTNELRMSWKDFQLTYFNLVKSRLTCYYDRYWDKKNKHVQMQPVNDPLPIDPVLSTEDLIFPGPQNDLLMIQNFKLEYLSNNHLQKFPFDQRCDFLMRIRVPSNKSVMFVPVAEAVTYNGPKFFLHSKS